MTIIAVDTETTGLDLFHQTRPFLISTLTEDSVARVWRWDVDPKTRMPIVNSDDLDEIGDYLSGHTLVFHNAIFDLRALSTVGIIFEFEEPAFQVPCLFNSSNDACGYCLITCGTCHPAAALRRCRRRKGQVPTDQSPRHRRHVLAPVLLRHDPAADCGGSNLG